MGKRPRRVIPQSEPLRMLVTEEPVAMKVASGFGKGGEKRIRKGNTLAAYFIPTASIKPSDRKSKKYGSRTRLLTYLAAVAYCTDHQTHGQQTAPRDYAPDGSQDTETSPSLAVVSSISRSLNVSMAR